MKNPFIKYIMREKKEDIFHSSAYGKAQSAEAMGVASVESFGKRMEIDGNRQVIKRYNDSRIMNGAYVNGQRAKEYARPEKDVSMKAGGTDTKNNTSTPGVSDVSRVNGTAPRMGVAAPTAKRFAPTIKPKF